MDLQVSLDIMYRPELPIQSLQDFKKRLKSSLDDSQYLSKIFKARQSAQLSGRYRISSYSVGDKAWVNKSSFTNVFANSQVSDKLSARRYGPFTVKELI